MFDLLAFLCQASVSPKISQLEFTKEDKKRDTHPSPQSRTQTRKHSRQNQRTPLQLVLPRWWPRLTFLGLKQVNDQSDTKCD